ncbi:polymeric immunoglobulin receptor-like [Danio aesculapii]|uniref:polymeric immunoglobulin receptor-like n=1 Tax=Danio aesculapii TaxID=1142201 RepID=UPI0024C09F2C|nr:polymeric immunoglobulin receptor-like [Danio aesculapii]
MKILLINFLTLQLISGQSFSLSVTGYSGGSLMLDSGKLWFSDSNKYLAKLPDWRTIIKDRKHERWINEGRFTLFLNNNGNLMIFIRDLNTDDAGQYWIGALYNWGADLTLHVEEDSCCASKRVIMTVGETGSFSCEYSHNHINDPKIIFKEERDSIEMIYSTLNKKERFNISDDRQRNSFSVSITAVTADDGGVYLLSPVVRREGESAQIFCPYDSIYQSKSKSLCKGKCSTRDTHPLDETVREEKERLTLHEDVTASVFTGTITGLTAEDAGKYWCAVTLDRELNYLYTHLMVIINQELSLTKYEGDDVSIQCRHHDGDQKSFCKAHKASTCVKDGDSLETIRDARFSISDEASAGVFTVNITDLRADDSGVYWCGAHAVTKVNLRVKTDFTFINLICMCSAILLIGGFTLVNSKVGVSTVIGSSGAALMIKCEHPQHKTKTKYICKESSAGCSGDQEEWMKNGDVSVDDDTRAGVLMVFFRELKAADAGTYRCGVKDSEYTERFTQLQLNITHDGKYPKVMTESVHLGGEVNISCQIPEEKKNIYFCKENDLRICQITRASEEPQLTSEERVFNVSIRNVNVRDAGVYWCGAETRDTHVTFISLTTKIQLSVISDDFTRIIIIVNVCITALLAGGFTLAVCKLRHKTTEKTCTSEVGIRETNTSSDSLDPDPGSAEMISPDEGSSDGLQYTFITFQKQQESLSKAAVALKTSRVYPDYTLVVLPQ